MRDDPRWARIQTWKPVREVFQSAAQLFEEAERLRGATEAEAGPAVGGAWGGAAAAAAAPGHGKAGPTSALPAAPAAYLRRRAALREAIEARLDPTFTEQLGAWQKHLCLTAIVGFIDERERVALGALADAWRLPLLQTEMLGIDDGGDRCFVQLQELLARADVHPLVFEIHLLCLRAGFVGRYRDRRHELGKLNDWIVARLRQYQPRRGGMVVPAAPQASRRRVGFINFPLRYYIGVAAAIVVVFAALRIASDRAVQRSSLAAYCQRHDAGGAP